MAGKYYQKINGVDYDVATLCEPKVHDAAPGFGSLFTGEGEFQKAGTDTANIALDGYAVDGTAITAVKRGHYPTFNSLIGSFDSPGTYTITRSDDYLAIGSTKLKTTSFTNQTIPHELIFVVVGAGGGGAGCGWYEPDKDVYKPIEGGAGGGGAVVAARVAIDNNKPITAVVGAGGSCGSSKSGSSSTSGNNGANGGDSYLRINNTTVITAGGGKGGTGGSPKGEDDNEGYWHGNGGGGGSATVSVNSTTGPVFKAESISGGGGEDGPGLYSHRARLEFTTASGTGATKYEVVEYLFEDLSNGDPDWLGGSFFSGGWSYGNGGYRSKGDSTTYTPSFGGGGGAGTHSTIVQSGANGCILIYY